MRKHLIAASVPLLGTATYLLYPYIRAFVYEQLYSDENPQLPDLLNLSLIDARHAIQNGMYTSEELVLAYLARNQEVDDEVHAILRLNPNAVQQAREADRLRSIGAKLGRLHGLPILIKDNVAVKSLPTTAGSLALCEAEFPRQATVVQKLLDDGAIILGKTGLSEWSNYRSEKSSNGWNAITGQCFGGYHHLQDPSGSSSGSSVATSLGLALGSIGSETDGSIIMPAEINNVVGLKPTVGRTSRYGVVPISDTQDTVGPITRTVADAALMLDVIAGHDPKDEKTQDAPAQTRSFSAFASNLDEALSGFWIGVARELFKDEEVPEFVLAEFDKAITTLSGLNADVLDVTLPDYNKDRLEEDEKVVLSLEFKTSLESYLSQLDNHSVKTLDQVIEFTKTTEKEDFPFRDIDRLSGSLDINEQQPDPEFRSKAIARSRANGITTIDSAIDSLHSANPRSKGAVLVVPAQYASGIAAVAGHPILTIPLGFAPAQTPIEYNKLGTTIVKGPNFPFGIAFIGKRWDEETLIRVGYALEQAIKSQGKPKGVLRQKARPKTQLSDIK